MTSESSDKQFIVDFTRDGIGRDARVFEATGKEGVFVARLDLAALRECGRPARVAAQTSVGRRPPSSSS